MIQPWFSEQASGWIIPSSWMQYSQIMYTTYTHQVSIVANHWQVHTKQPISTHIQLLTIHIYLYTLNGWNYSYTRSFDCFKRKTLKDCSKATYVGLCLLKNKCLSLYIFRCIKSIYYYQITVQVIEKREKLISLFIPISDIF